MGLLMFVGRSAGAPEMVSIVVGVFASLAYVSAKLSKQDGPPGGHNGPRGP